MDAAPKPVEPTAPAEHPRSDAVGWAGPVTRINVADLPTGTTGLNVSGRRLTGPIQGFGSLWQKTYRLRLGTAVSPAEAVSILKAQLPELQPPQNRFFPSITGVAPGEVVLITARVSGMPISTGVLVMYADDEAFTLMTPEGHPESGWVTFSASADAAGTVVQIQSLARANDPIYELGFRFMGGSGAQEAIWRHVLQSLGERAGVVAAVELEKVCVDGHLQWRATRNVWRNAVIRTTLYTLAAPARGLGRLVRGR